MKLSSLRRFPARWRARAMRLGFNLNPAFRATGGRVQSVSHDLSRMRIRLPLVRRTRNFVGSLYGGSLFAITDGAHVALVLSRIERDIIVWDKAASIRYRRPAYGTVYADFYVTDEDVLEICRALDRDHEVSYRFTVDIRGKDGTLYCVVERVVYIADKPYYKQKRG